MTPEPSKNGTRAATGVRRLQARPNLHAGSPGLTTMGVLFLLVFCFVIMSHKLPLGEVAVAGSFVAILVSQVRVSLPSPFYWYLAFVALGSVSHLLKPTPYSNLEELVDTYKVVLIGVSLYALVATERNFRIFALGYLTLFALYPVRGALYNYAYGITEFGRIAWNFAFSNPNDLASYCLLPLGLCGVVVVKEKGWLRIAATIGISSILLIVLLTQSRGAIVALGVSALYYVVETRRRIRALIFIFAAVAMPAVLAPDSVWDRVSGLSRASVHDMSQVDPEGSAEGRWALIQVGIGIALDNPLIGVGFGNFPYYNYLRTKDDQSAPFSIRRRARDAHSAYIRAAAEAGLFGSLGVLGFVLGSIGICRRARRLARGQGAAFEPDIVSLLVLEVAMVAFAVAIVFGSAERTTFMLLQFAVPVAFARIVMHRLEETMRVSESVSTKAEHRR